MKNGHLLRVAAAILAVFLLPGGSSMVRADGNGERKNVRGGGGGTPAAGDGNPDKELSHDINHPQPKQESVQILES